MRGNLLIRLAPCTDLEASAYPAELFIGALGSSQRRADSTANRAPRRSCRFLCFYRLLRQLQNLRGDDWLGRHFLFHSRLHYRTHRLFERAALLESTVQARQTFPVHRPQLRRSIAAHHITRVERRMTMRALLPRLHDESLRPPNDFSLHRVGADRTIGQVYARRCLALGTTFVHHRNHL